MNFETQSNNRLFFRCVIPSIISMAVSSIYTIVDGIFVGRLLGQDALAAVNLVMPCIMIFFALSDMVAAGSSVQISMLLGQGKQKEASVTFSACLKLLSLYACAAGWIGFFAVRPILHGMGASAVVTELAAQYLQVFAVFALPAALFFAIDNYLRVCGKQRYSMVLNVITALANILLDALFLVCFHWGIWAAALASALSMTVGTILSLLPFFRSDSILSFTRGHISLKQFGRLLVNGSSELFTNIASSLLMLMLNIVLLRLGGSVAVAAMSVVMYVDSLMGSVLFGLAEALQPPISYFYGQGASHRIWALEKRVLVAAGLISLAALLIMRFSGSSLIILFIEPDNAPLRAMSLTAIKIFAFSYFVTWIDGCLGSFLTALDFPLASLLATLCGSLLFPAIALLLSALWGLNGIWYMPLTAGIASALVSILLTWLALKKRPLPPG